MIQKGGGGGGVSNSSYVTTKGTGVTSDPFLQVQSSSGLLDSYYSSRARPRALNGKVTLDETGETDPYWSEEKRHFTYEPHHDRSNKGIEFPKSSYFGLLMYMLCVCHYECSWKFRKLAMLCKWFPLDHTASPRLCKT